jgi:multiple sugar transport system permease protein
VGELIACTLAGYGFARLKFFGRDAIFLLVLGTMMLPYQVTIIPLFILFRNFGWLNTHLPLIVPSYFGSPFYIFIMRQFFLNIPSELEDAAAIDGCSNIRTFWNVFLPLAKPAVVSVGLFTFWPNGTTSLTR